MRPGTALLAMVIVTALSAHAFAPAQQGTNGGHWSGADPGALPWEAHGEAPGNDEAGLLDALYDAHENLTEIMIAQAGGDYSMPDYPLVMSYVDRENEELVVMMHVMAALAGIEYGEEELHLALGVKNPEVSIEIIYGTFVPSTVAPPTPPAEDPPAPPAEDPPAPVPAPPPEPAPDPPATAQPEPSRPKPTPPTYALRGGMPLAERLPEPSPWTGTLEPAIGTTGIAVNHAGVSAMLVSSHVIDSINAPGKQPISLAIHDAANASAPLESMVLATSDIISNIAVSSDAAIVSANGASTVPVVGEIQNGTSAASISAYGGTDGLLGQKVEIIGAMSYTRGVIAAEGVTIRGTIAGNDRVITDHAMATYFATGGDSGAPIVHTDSGGKSAFLGMHVGSIQMFYIAPDGQAMPMVRHAPNGVANGQYGVFSTWENIARDLGL